MEREYLVQPSRTMLLQDTMRASLSVRDSLKPGDICLYIGVPFCPTRCAYCSFVSNSVEKSGELIEPFLKVLFRELRAAGTETSKLGLRVVSVYLGGGTPTALSATQLRELFQNLYGAFDLSSVTEITAEAGRPDTIDAEKSAVLKNAGVTRISVNPQTLSDEVLEIIGRRHTRADFFAAFDLVKSAGFMNINTDLIAGLPGDSETGFHASIDGVLALKPANITVHTLALKKGSKIMIEGSAVPDGETVGRLLEYASDRLREEGYRPYYVYRLKYTAGGYENTGWCIPGTESFYNICMMEEHATVLGLGGGAASKLVFPGGRIERVFNPKYPKEYIERSDKICTTKFREISEMLQLFSRGGDAPQTACPI
jgi:oxygen-independent coproporphyrinogen-3 oxidase